MSLRTETETVVKKILPYLRRRDYVIETDLDFETPVKVPDRYNQGYVDILVTCGKTTPRFAIEAKRFSKTLTYQDRDQALAYGKGFRVPFVAVTNGRTIQCFNTHTNDLLQWNGRAADFIPSKQQLPRVLSALRADKTAVDIQVNIDKELDESLPFRPGLPLKQLNALFGRCHDAIRKIEHDEEHAFADFSKLLFLKLLEEKWDEGEIELPYSYRFHDLAALPENRFDQLRDNVRTMLDMIHAKTSFGDVLLDGMHLTKPKTFGYIIGALAGVSFRDSSADSKGAAFEYFVRATLKGKRLGQYFTPRPLVELMIAMVGREKISNAAIHGGPFRVLDPSCGTGGFLVYGMRESLRTLARKKAAEEISQGVHDQARKRIMQDIFFGSEASAGVACAAKMNMIVAGDGHTNICAENSLEADAANWSTTNPTCDIILTNPPFGTSEADALSKEDKNIYPVPGTKGQHLFLQRMVLAAVPGGDICTVIDEGVLNTESAKTLRLWLVEQCRVVAVVHLPEETFKPNKINVKSSVLYLKRRKSADVNHTAEETVTFCELSTLGYYGSGEPIRGYDANVTCNEVAARIQRKNTMLAGDRWSAFDVSMRDIWKDPGTRLDVKFWNPATRSGIAALLTKPTACLLRTLLTRDPRRGRNPDTEFYVDEADGYALVVKSGTNVTKFGTLAEDGEDFDFIEKNLYDQYGLVHIQDGDVLLSSSGDGTLGKCCVFRSNRPAIADGHVTILRPDTSRVVPEYLCDYLRVGFGAEQIQRLFSGSTGMIELTTLHIEAIVVDLLGGDLAAQKRVSDDLRAGEQAAIRHREHAEIAHTDAVHEFVHGPFRPVDGGGDLVDVYDGLNDPLVVEILRTNQTILNTLREARPHIRHHFGAESRTTLYVEHEYDGETTLYASVSTSGTEEELLARLSNFDREWWLARPNASPLVFTAGCV